MKTVTELRPARHSCRVCRRAIDPSPEASNSQWALCLVHAAALAESARNRLVLAELVSMVARGQLALTIDSKSQGWLTPIKPTPPPPRPLDYAPDGTPSRYRDMSNRLGITLLPDDDLPDGVK